MSRTTKHTPMYDGSGIPDVELMHVAYCNIMQTHYTCVLCDHICINLQRLNSQYERK